MNWHTGDIAEAVNESKAKDAIFVVYIEGENDTSVQLNRFLNDSRVHSKLMSNDFVAVKVQGGSASFMQFSSLYKVVPVPSIFFIGKNGTPLTVATGVTGSVEELVAKIDKALLLAGKQQVQNEASTSFAATVLSMPEGTARHIAGADSDESVKDTIVEPTAQPTVQSTAQPIDQPSIQPIAEADPEPEQTTLSAEEPLAVNVAPVAASPEPPSQQEILTASVSAENIHTTATAPASHEPTAAALSAAAAAERRAAATGAAAATATAILPNSLGTLITNSVSFVPPGDITSQQASSQQSAVSHVTDVDVRMSHVQQVLEQKKREREEEQRKEDRENELRRRREGRDSQAQQVITKEQELKNMQERIRRDRQQEVQARERILAQIAADRAEQATRISTNSDMHSINTVTTTTTAAVISPEPSTSSVNEARLQIRLPSGLTRTKAFAADEPLATVRVYVLNELLAGSEIREFTLATSYPRREFKTEDEAKTLVELNLVPNAVLLVLKSAHTTGGIRSSNNLIGILTSVIWAILTPAAVAFDYMNKVGFRRLRERVVQLVSNIGWRKSIEPGTGTAGDVLPRTDAAARRNMDMFAMRTTPAPGMPGNTQNRDASEQPPPAKTAARKGSKTQLSEDFRAKRYGESNIRRLADTQRDDDDDKATYNGNSTQQQ